MELTQKLKDEFAIVPKTVRRIPEVPKFPVTYQRPRIIELPGESDRRALQAEIVRDLKVDQLTPASFRTDDRMIESIKIPDKTDVDTIKVFP